MGAVLPLTLVAVFGAVGVTTGWLAWTLLMRAAPERRRLEQVISKATTSSGMLIDAPMLSHQDSALARKIAFAVPRAPKEMTRLRKRFARAGYDTLTAVAIYTTAQMVLPIVFGVTPLLLGLDNPWLMVGVGVLLGLQLPQTILLRLIKKRQKIIENGLPDALDLLIVCLEAGSAIDQAIVKVSDELAIAYPPLAEELRQVITETRAGKRRIDAFRSFAERTGVEDVRALVAMLVQTDRFGTSISQALRTQSETARTKRRQRAEEAAAKIGVKLVFPLVLFLFPAFFVVTIGPSAIQFIKVFFTN